MPLYEYQCEACGRRFEAIRKFSDPVLDLCTLCGGGPVTRLPSSPAFQFKGSGWYVTDYARKSDGDKSDAAPADKTQDAKPDAAADKGGKGDKADKAGKTEPAARTETAAKSEPAKPAASPPTTGGGGKN
jgi:putative FmdB family regulatory protein